MKQLLAALVMVLAFGVASPARADDYADCVQAADLDHTIRGCSNIIAAGLESPETLAEAYANRGTAHLHKGDYDGAIADLGTAIQLSPQLAEAYYNRGSAYNAKGDYHRAVADYQTVVRLLPENSPIRTRALVHVTALRKKLAAGPMTPDLSRRVALVIGNSAYSAVPVLRNPASDAKLIAAALQQDGFSVTHADDLDRDGLAKALRTFGHEADGADWAVIYYAGHGIEIGGTNYLIPVDARLENDRDVGLEAVPLEHVISSIEGASSLRLVILDACRNNPFAATIKRTAGGGRDIGRGLGRVEPAQATLVAYSAKDGSIAADGDGANSPYAVALAAHLTEPGVEVDKLFRLVRDDVLDATGKKQEPFVYGSLPGRQDFYFQPATPGIAITNGGTAAPQIAAGEAAWQRVQRSTDPVVYESFGQFFPDSTHKAEADAKAKSLRAKAGPSVAALEPTAAPDTFQKAMLYEEPVGATGDGNNVTAINAKVSWRYVESGTNGPEIEADLQVPERNMKVKLTIHKNADKALPASHLIEIRIDTPADLPGKSVKKVPRLVMKPTEEAHGQPLVGIDAKITAGYFWIALSGANADFFANLALLRERDWIDLPFVYETGQRAILTFEKGTPGERVFRQAMAAWSRG